MAFEVLRAEIALLLEGATEHAEDWHDQFHRIMQQLNGLKASGMPLPADLVELEVALEARFAEECSSSGET
jgi:hypothetical protein